MKFIAAFGALAVLAACGKSEPQAQKFAGPHPKASVSPVPAAAPLAKKSVRPARAKPVACTSQEETIFYCPMSGGKRLAVCAKPDGETEYRFGGASPEIVLTGGEWASVPYSGGGEAQMLFGNKDTDYVVFSRMVRTHFVEGEPNYPAISDGVVILRDGNLAAIRLCEGGQAELPIKVFAAERLLAKHADLFTYETSRADSDLVRLSQ